ncbi:putative membrane protein [Streptomyces davaonensis JCM 4913]|uniref:Putative membrane protein n=1 Tax=Streptomyces davaonensis (strain DSM 101723 / JCM 4913 / KCC S-0913 / 768) TaxID=1214101 RepID=K4RFW3_STRDJ|nr:hypothetical protein [Streptomyces davaonensis]CCK32530.1 putative membrane protein [Streptomyces davaonensis JCM 4913]
MTMSPPMARRSVVLALQEITEDLAAQHGLAAENDDEALQIVEALLTHADAPGSAAWLLDDEGLALDTGRRLLDALAEDPGTRSLAEPLLAEPPVDDQLAVVEVSAGVVVLVALVAFLQTKVSVKMERKTSKGKVSFELTKEATKGSTLMQLADLYQRILGQGGGTTPTDPGALGPGQGPTDPPGTV